METTTFWTSSRRRLIGKTLANLFLLLIGAAATGEAFLRSPTWVRWLFTVGIVLVGSLAVIVMPESPDEGDD